MWAAVTSAVVLIALAASGLFFSRPLFLGLVAVLLVGAIWEIAGALARIDIRVVVVPLYIGGLAMLVAASLGSLFWLVAAGYLTFIVIVPWRLFETPEEGQLRDVMASAFTIVYLPFLAAFVGLISFHSQKSWPLVFFVLALVGSDTGGWLAGITLGKHPMAPKLSPKKSWEGFVGSVAFATLFSLGGTFVMELPWWWSLIFGFTAAAVGTLGDLTESLIKRTVGLKDMSNIVPGHGGLMDRLDSLLFTAPAFYILYSYAFDWPVF